MPDNFDAELSAIWAAIAQSRATHAKYIRGDPHTAAVLRDAANNAQHIANSLRREALEQLFWRAWHPTEAEKRALGLDDVLWPEQLKRAHREYVGLPESQPPPVTIP